jgi:ribokinase
VRLAVIGHVEWCQFVRVERTPASGDVAHAVEWWEEPGGGGAVAAVELTRLGGGAELYTALGDDELGRKAQNQLTRLGVRVHAAVRDEPTRRAFVSVDGAGERTITVLGDKLVPKGNDPSLPWHELADAEAVFFVSGDADALRTARRARTLVATARELATLRFAGVELDALVGSGEDEGERYHPGALDPPPRLVVTTSGALGGWAQPGGPFRASPPPGPVEDAYGCGDCFGAGLAFALARGLEGHDALELGARSGAEALARRGAHGRSGASARPGR